MPLLTKLGVLFLAYLIGSVPVGFIIVKIVTGQDIRDVQSGRTGGTNAMRAGGFFVGLSTAILDIFKGACTVWLARALLVPEDIWVTVLSPMMGIIGHNYSFFLMSRGPNGKLRLGGGAGGAATLGGSMGLWTPSGPIIFVIGAAIFYFVGYASVTTMSVAVLSVLIFTYRAIIGVSPWQYAVYGILAELLLIWALRPNIKRLLTGGDERLHGYRKRKREQQAAAEEEAAKS